MRTRVGSDPVDREANRPQPRLASAVVAAALCLLLSACATQEVRPTLPPTNISAEIAEEVRRAVIGWNGGELGAFLELYAETATFALADGFLQGRSEIREFYAPNFKPGVNRAELSFERLDVEVLSPDTALVRGIYRNTLLGQVTRRGTTTLIFRRIAGVWRIIHDHTN